VAIHEPRHREEQSDLAMHESCHREERSDVAIHGLPRFARNDEFRAMHTNPSPLTTDS
jgi:hypothetical protein